MSYTFQQVFPTLAMLEDESPPAYGPISLDDDPASLPDDAPGTHKTKSPRVTRGAASTVTSSLRATCRLFYANGGIRSFFRGFACLFAHSIATSFLFGIFSLFLPSVLASVSVLLASLALVQLSTAWVHIIITPRSELHFWSRLPSFRRAFKATAHPTALYWLALQVSNFTPLFLAWALGLPLPAIGAKPGEPTTVPEYDTAVACKSLVITILSIAVSVFLVIPAHVVLVRVQASLLPEGEDTIIPFDGSFGGAVVPAVVGGTGYASMKNAWKTFSASAWRRLIGLYFKLFGVNVLVMFAMAAILAPQVFLIMSHSTLKEPVENN